MRERKVKLRQIIIKDYSFFIYQVKDTNIQCQKYLVILE